MFQINNEYEHLRIPCTVLKISADFTLMDNIYGVTHILNPT